MGKKLVGFNRFLHGVMGLLADVSLGGIVLVIAVIVANRCIFNQGLEWAAGAPELLVTLPLFLVFAWIARAPIQMGVRLGCDWFPHNARARKAIVLAFDALALACGLGLLAFSLGRMRDGTGSGAGAWWWIPVSMGGMMLAFDAVLLLAGTLSHEDAYAFRHVPEYRWK